jgi:hypothetical protein
MKSSQTTTMLLYAFMAINLLVLQFLTTVSQNIMYQTAPWVPSQTSQAYRNLLDNVFSVYNTVYQNYYNNESQLLMEELQVFYGVSMNYTNPQEHVPEAECNNRNIKEMFRASFHRLPFKMIPKIMVNILTMEVETKRSTVL